MNNENISLNLPSQTVPLRIDSHGAVRVGNTRVTLMSVLESYHSGNAPEIIVEQFPMLDLADVYVVIGYYLQNKHEIDVWYAEKLAEAEALRAKIEAESDPIGIRELLLSRRKVK